jgi:hypothetical protein
LSEIISCGISIFNSNKSNISLVLTNSKILN